MTSDLHYNITNILSGKDLPEGTTYYYECDECMHVYGWNTGTLMQALFHSQKTGHTKGRVSYKIPDDKGDTE